MSQESRESTGCAYCGEPATTRDHVPPRGLFPSPGPPDLITVPSCQPCNRAAGPDDELFRVALVLREELEDHPQAAEVARTTMRGLQRPGYPGLRRSLVSSLREFERRSPAGLVLGRATEYSVPLGRIVAVSDRITRGLFYHHFGTRVPEGYSVASRPSSTLDPTDPQGVALMLDLVRATNPSVFAIGSGVFQYRFGQTDEDPAATFWVYVFFNSISFLSVTVPVGEPTRDAAQQAAAADEPQRGPIDLW